MRALRWQQVLDAKVEEWRPRVLSWGKHDCCQFVRDVTLAITGVDRGGSFPAYSSYAAASALVDEAGGMAAFLSSVFGTPKHPARAQRGDVVAVETGAGLTAGICIGVRCACFGPAGLTFYPMSAAQCAWAV